MVFDLIVFGGGPAGYSGAAMAAKKGLNVVLFEEKSLGGVCLNEGCIPTKALLYSAKTYDAAVHAAKYGVTASEVKFDLSKIMARKSKTIRKLVAGIKAKMNEAGVTVIMGAATILGKEQDQFLVSSGDMTYSAPKMILCSGAQTFVPPIEGLQANHFITHREALELKVVPESMLVIGGGVIGMEFASFYHSMGAKVTVVEMADEILPLLDRELGKGLREEYSKKGVLFMCGVRVSKFLNDGSVVCILSDGSEQVLQAEKVLIATGRKPHTEGFGLETLGVEQTRRGLVVDNRLQTNVEGLFACGDVNGRMQLAHTAIRDAECAVRTILGIDDEANGRVVPSVVYTNPEVATVGKSEEELKMEGIEYIVKRLPMSFSGRFVAENELGSGFCKLLVTPDDQIVGAHLLGNPSSELILTLAVFMEQRISVHAAERIIFPHPTVGEIIKETLEA